MYCCVSAVGTSCCSPVCAFPCARSAQTALGPMASPPHSSRWTTSSLPPLLFKLFEAFSSVCSRLKTSRHSILITTKHSRRGEVAAKRVKIPQPAEPPDLKQRLPQRKGTEVSSLSFFGTELLAEFLYPASDLRHAARLGRACLNP